MMGLGAANKVIKNVGFFILFFVFIGGQSRQEVLENSRIENILKVFHDSDSPCILIAAHRAMHTKYPENSLASIRHAIDSGVDIVEIDVRKTKDGKLVLMHDKTIDRTTIGKGELKNYTYAELQVIPLKNKEGDADRHTVPLLEDALNLAKGKIMVDLDIKDTFTKELVEMVHKTNTENLSLFFDSDYSVLDSVQLLDSTLLLMPRAYSLKDVKQIISDYNPPVIHIDPGFYTDEVVLTIKNSGARVWINALGVPDAIAGNGPVDSAYSPLILRGANIIQTDFPELMRSFLIKNNLHN